MNAPAAPMILPMRPVGRFGRAGMLAMATWAALTAGCAPSGVPEGQQLLVGVSIIPEVWLVKAIGGQRVDVVPLVQPGESPHTYQPTDAQVSRLMRAAVYFRIGVPFEQGPWFQTLTKSGRVKIVDLREGVPLRTMEEAHGHDDDDEHDHDHGPGATPHKHAHAPGQTCNCCSLDGKDPHIWVSPRLLKIQAITIGNVLATIDPGHAAAYRANLGRLLEQLSDLDREIATRLAAAKGKAFFVFHPAWGYFAEDYGLTQMAIEIDGKEPSDRELTELQRQARATGAKIVFVQPQISGKAAQAVAQATGGRVETVDVLSADLATELLRMATLLEQAYR